ncbi:hypothetical protein [Celeribacter sp. ULVN23_4]
MRWLSLITTAPLAYLMAALPAPAMTPRDVPPLAREFAYCVGRLSATVEHQWLLSDPRSDSTLLHRTRMLSLLESVARPEQASQLLTLRLSAKVAHASLLQRATFDPSHERARAAHHRAEIALRQCLALILN